MNNLSASEYELLKNLWLSTQNQNVPDPDFNKNTAFKVLYGLNIGMEECMQYLYHNQPDLEEFIEWCGQFRDLTTENTLEHPDVLDEKDLQFWEQNGYIVLRQAIDQNQCLDATEAIWKFLDASPDNPESWYKSHPKKSGLMLLFTQHPALNTVRNSVKIRKAYEQLYGTNAIYKTIDKVSFNPPETAQHKFMGSSLHWDVSLAQPIPFKLQGLLYLSDVGENGGAFQCVPGFHRSIEDWINALPKGINIRQHALETLKPINIDGKAGDFIIWHQALPHCASPNHSTLPRMVQYLTYLPDVIEERKEWI